MQATALWVAHPNHHRSIFRHQPEAFFGFAELLSGFFSLRFSLQSFNSKTQLPGNGNGEFNLGGREFASVLIIRHELSNDPSLGDQRKERQAANSFLFYCCLNVCWFVGIVDVLHKYRIRLRLPWPPR